MKLILIAITTIIVVLKLLFGPPGREKLDTLFNYELVSSIDLVIPNDSVKSGYRDIVMLTHLVNSKEAIEKYEYLHSEKGIWPEVVKAAEVSGIGKIKIYRFETTLVMIITIPEESDLNEISTKYAAYSPRLKEWANLMATFQIAPSSLKPGEVWAGMNLIHHYEDGVVNDH